MNMKTILAVMKLLSWSRNENEFQVLFSLLFSSVHYCEDRFHIHNDLLLSVVM